MRASSRVLLGLLFFPAFFSTGCGYAFQGSQNRILEEHGIRKIYVEPLRNETFKAGVENTVYNALLRTIIAHGRVELVHSAEGADAIVRGSVMTAGYTGIAQDTANKFQPINEGPDNILIFNRYNASLVCQFALVEKGRSLWSSSFSRDKVFAANTQLGVLGATSAIINDSEFDRSLRNLADSMMDDVHESMLAMF